MIFRPTRKFLTLGQSTQFRNRDKRFNYTNVITTSHISALQATVIGIFDVIKTRKLRLIERLLEITSTTQGEV